MSNKSTTYNNRITKIIVTKESLEKAMKSMMSWKCPDCGELALVTGYCPKHTIKICQQ